MGRYDGEDYPEVPECAPGSHSFMFNGLCFRCRRSRKNLLERAKQTVKALEKEDE